MSITAESRPRQARPHGNRSTSLEDELGESSNAAAFKSSLLATDTTSVRLVGVNYTGSCIDQMLNDEYLEAYLKSKGSLRTAFLFINRFLVRGDEPWPDDANKLRLSQPAFELLRWHCHLSPSFINALANIQHPSPASFPNQLSHNNLDFWFFVPVRVQVKCNDQKVHTSSSKGRSQMNPLNYLHLNGPEVDIRGSKIAVHYLFKRGDTDESVAVVFNFQDGRWKKVVEEPIIRLKNAYRDCESAHHGRDPIYLQMAILNSALRWWNNSLNSFDDQLILYEEHLLRQDVTNGDLLRPNAEINQSLHCMAAHLHRYGSELRSLCEIMEQCRIYNRSFHKDFVRLHIRTAADDLGWMLTAFDRAASHLSAISTFRDELQRKIENVLALLVDNNKSISDQLLIQNSKTMQDILKATQAEAEQSLSIATETRHLNEEMTKILHATRQETEASCQLAAQSQMLTREMMEDSVAMRTVALLTAFFLPGTSFAAILDMPFFSETSSMKDTDKAWIWAVLTVPSTLLCFAFYFSWNRLETRKRVHRVTANGFEMAVRSTAAQQP